MEVLVKLKSVLVFSGISAMKPKHQHQDEHRLSHRKSSALWGKKTKQNKKHWVEMFGWWGMPPPPPPLSLAHKMQALPCRTCGFKGSAGPFIIALLFLSLAGLSDRSEAPGADDVTSNSASGPRDFNTFVFFSHQCEIVQYDGCLMLKQD